jgi:peptide/nickel transport system substrate-binding protein
VSTSTTPYAYSSLNIPLPRLFGIFFNENRSPALQDLAARQALSLAIDRQALITERLAGAGIPTSAPVFFATSTLESLYGITAQATSTAMELAAQHLRNNNWSRTADEPWKKMIDGTLVELEVRLKTSNTDVFSETAAFVAEAWEELGVRVTVEQYDQSSLVQTVIRPRDFEALLFGLDINRSEDLFPFWHSSQIDDPGLNIAQYTNVQVDTLLNQARTTLLSASSIIVSESPAIFLFQPTFRYIFSSDITLPNITHLSKPADRFMNSHLWHRNRAKLWPWFQSDIRSQTVENI